MVAWTRAAALDRGEEMVELEVHFEGRVDEIWRQISCGVWKKNKVRHSH